MKKSFFLAMLVCVPIVLLSFSFMGCTSSDALKEPAGDALGSTSAAYQTIEHDGYYFEISSGWDETKLAGGEYNYRPAGQANFWPNLNVTEFDNPNPATVYYSDQMSALRSSFTGFSEDGVTYEFTNFRQGFFDNNARLTANNTTTVDGEVTERSLVTVFFLSPTKEVIMWYYFDPANYDAEKSDADHVIGSVKPTTIKEAIEGQPDYPTPINDPNFWSNKPISSSTATLTIKDELDILDSQGITYQNVRVYYYLKDSGYWFDATKYQDQSLYKISMFSAVDFDANGDVLIQCAGE